MKKWLTTIFVFSTLVSGVLAGTPLPAGNSMMMKCCDRAKSKDKTPAAEAARLCCLINCSNSTPTPSGSSINFTASGITVSQSIANQIAALFPAEKAQLSASPQYSREVLQRTFQPRYIQHNSLLI